MSLILVLANKVNFPKTTLENTGHITICNDLCHSYARPCFPMPISRFCSWLPHSTTEILPVELKADDVRACVSLFICSSIGSYAVVCSYVTTCDPRSQVGSIRMVKYEPVLSFMMVNGPCL